MSINIGYSKTKVSLVGLFIFTVFFCLLNLSSLDSTICNIFMVASGCLCFISKADTRRMSEVKSKILLYVIFMFTLGCICKFVNDNRSWQFLFGVVAYAGIAMVIIEEEIGFNTFKRVYYIVVVWYTLRYLLDLASRGVFIKDGVLSTDIALLILYILMVFAAQREQKKVGNLPVMVGMLPVFLSLKRMGMIIWTILAAFQMSYDEEHNKFVIGRRIILIMATFILAYIIAANVFENYFIQFANRFYGDGITVLGLADSRMGIWAGYVHQLSDFKYLLFGAAFSNSYILQIYFGNVHNSLLNCHATVGLAGLFVNLLLVAKAIISYTKNEKLFIAGLLTIIFIRGMSDFVFWFNWGDIVLNVLIFYPIATKMVGYNNAKNAYLQST